MFSQTTRGESSPLLRMAPTPLEPGQRGGGPCVFTQTTPRRIDSWITQLKAQGPSRTCNASKENWKHVHADNTAALRGSPGPSCPSLSLCCSPPLLRLGGVTQSVPALTGGGARPVHLIITMIKWIRTSRLSTKNSLSLSGAWPWSETPDQPSPARARRFRRKKWQVTMVGFRSGQGALAFNVAASERYRPSLTKFPVN